MGKTISYQKLIFTWLEILVLLAFIIGVSLLDLALSPLIVLAVEFQVALILYGFLNLDKCSILSKLFLAMSLLVFLLTIFL